jgi:hypothetical protein
MIHENLEGLEMNGTRKLLVNANDAGFGVLTAQVMKSSIFRDTTSCGPLKVNQRFRGTCHHILRRIRVERKQRE